MRKKQPDADEADYADRTDPLRNNPSGVPPPGQETATAKGQEQQPRATAQEQQPRATAQEQQPRATAKSNCHRQQQLPQATATAFGSTVGKLHVQ